MKISLVYTTLPDIESARTLARQAIDAKLASCVNILPHGNSIYIWNDAIEESEETYLIFKTQPSHLDALRDFIAANHQYDVPAIISADADANPAFSEYMGKNLA